MRAVFLRRCAAPASMALNVDNIETEKAASEPPETATISPRRSHPAKRTNAMPTSSKIFTMSMVLAAGVILGLTIAAGYAAESSETVPAEIVRTGFRLLFCLAFFLTAAIVALLCQEPVAKPRREKTPEEIARIKRQFYEGRRVEVTSK